MFNSDDELLIEKGCRAAAKALQFNDI